MPSYFSKEARRHVDEARLFYQRYERELGQDDPDAALIWLFLSALHLVQAHAIQESKKPNGPTPPGDHASRKEYLATHLRAIVVPYRRLQAASEAARYDLVKHGREEVEAFHDQEFTRIREYLTKRRQVPW